MGRHVSVEGHIGCSASVLVSETQAPSRAQYRIRTGGPRPQVQRLKRLPDTGWGP